MGGICSSNPRLGRWASRKSNREVMCAPELCPDKKMDRPVRSRISGWLCRYIKPRLMSLICNRQRSLVCDSRDQ